MNRYTIGHADHLHNYRCPLSLFDEYPIPFRIPLIREPGTAGGNENVFAPIRHDANQLRLHLSRETFRLIYSSRGNRATERERESGREGERSLARRVLRIIRKEKKTVELFFLLLFFLPFFNFYRTSERWCRGKELISKNLNRSPDEKRDYSKRGTNSYHVIVSLKQRSSSDHLFSTQRIARLTSTCSLLLSDLVCVTRRWNARIRSALPYK